MPQPKFKKDNPLHSYAYYSSIGIEMGVIIALGVFGGVQLDKWLNLKPLFTIVLSLASVGIAIYVMIKPVLLPKKTKDEPKDTH